MKNKFTAIVAGTMVALTGATLPASAFEAHEHTFDFARSAPNTIGQQQHTMLLAVKTGKSGAVKGGHSTGKSPSKTQKHQEGETRRNQDQNINPAWQTYKKNKGKLAKSAWMKAGMPTRDK